MNSHAEIVGQVVDYMLAQRNAQVASLMVRQKLILMLLTKVTELGKCISNGASHAGRTIPCYFDVERAFRLFGIQAKELIALRNLQIRSDIANVAELLELSEEQIHRSPQLDMNQQRGTRGGYHIPKYLPPYPSLHTYRYTLIDNSTDRTYVTERNRLALHHVNTQRAINSFFLGTESTASLFTETNDETEFMVLAVKLPEKPAFMAALMPHDEIFDMDIYEFKDTPNEKALTNPYLKEPRISIELETETDQEKQKEQNMVFKTEESQETNKEPKDIEQINQQDQTDQFKEGEENMAELQNEENEDEQEEWEEGEEEEQETEQQAQEKEELELETENQELETQNPELVTESQLTKQIKATQNEELTKEELELDQELDQEERDYELEAEFTRAEQELDEELDREERDYAQNEELSKAEQELDAELDREQQDYVMEDEFEQEQDIEITEEQQEQDIALYRKYYDDEQDYEMNEELDQEEQVIELDEELDRVELQYQYEQQELEKQRKRENYETDMWSMHLYEDNY